MSESDREIRKKQLQEMLKPAKKATTPKRAQAIPQAAGNVIIVNGDGVAAHQIVGGNVYHQTFHQAPPRPKVVVIPGENAITSEQAFVISELRKDWVALHNQIKKTPLTDAASWARIKNKARVVSYHEIPQEKYDMIVTYLKTEMAKLRNMKSAPSKDLDWRKNRIAAIKARCNKQLGDPDLYKAYIKKRFSAESLTDLANDDLQKTYSYIFNKKPNPAV